MKKLISHRVTTVAVVAVAAALLCLPATAAQASGTAPHHAAHAKPSFSKFVAARFGAPRHHAKVVTSNELLNSDIAIDAQTEYSQGTVAEGHLALHLKHGSSTSYTGTFVDNMGKGKSYKASGKNVAAATDAGTYTIKTHRGTFVFSYDAGGNLLPGAKTPKSFGSHRSSGIDIAVPHAYTRQATILAEIGFHSAFSQHKAIAGNLSLTTDALSFVVPNSSKLHSVSKFAFSTEPGVKGATSKITSSGYYSPIDSAGGGGLFLGVKLYGVNYVISAAEEDNVTSSDFTDALEGDAYSGSGSSLVDLSFEAGDINIQ